jgi:hypothetical protein
MPKPEIVATLPPVYPDEFLRGERFHARTRTTNAMRRRAVGDLGSVSRHPTLMRTLSSLRAQRSNPGAANSEPVADGLLRCARNDGEPRYLVEPLSHQRI